MKKIKRQEAEAMSTWLLDEAKKNGAAEADVLYVNGESHSLELRDGEVEDNTSGVSSGISLRTLDGKGRQGVAYTNRFDRHSLTDVVRWSMNNCAVSEPKEGIALAEGPWQKGQENLPEPLCEDEKIYDITPSFRERQCLDMTKEAQRDGKVISVRSASWSDGWGESFFAATNGRSFWEIGTSASCGLAVVMQKGEFIEMGGSGDGSRQLADMNALKTAQEAIEKTARSLGGQSVPTGQYKLVLSREVAADLLDEIAGLFSAADVHKNRSLMKGKLGKKVASEIFTLTDDATIPWGIASSAYDIEGIPAQSTVLIKDGTAEAYLYNLEYARLDKVPSTGNASRGLAGTPTVSDSNIVLTPGSLGFSQILSACGGAIHISELMGLHTMDSVSGDFSFGAKGNLIKDGALASPVSGITIAGNLLDFLQKIIVIGNDLKFFGSVGSCTLVIDDVAVAGC